jgi:quinolinate synthase
MTVQPKRPDSIANLSEAEAHEVVRAAKRKLGSDVLILGHHYQRDEVIEHSDITGDSLKLARAAQVSSAKNIIFCGVHFMAESADILTGGTRFVSLPDLGAGCDMADMADARDVQDAFDEASAAVSGKIIPVTYINSSAALKAFVGRNNGVICTSSNAAKIVTWALEHGQHVFFFPDQHLGRNISKALGLSPDKDMLLWDPKLSLGGHSADTLRSRSVWLWKGHCPVHALFTVHQVKKIREASPETKILVHPECAMEIVDVSDLNGSTDFIIKTIEASAPGSRWAVGTEKHLVERLAKQHPDKHITSLNPFTCLCSTMNKISIHNLAWVMDGLANRGERLNQISVDPVTARDAVLALDRMMELSL